MNICMPSLFLVVLIVGSHGVSAMPASPLSFVETNSDGSKTGPLFIRGGPANHWTEDADGYTVCEYTENGTGQSTWFYCVQGADGDLIIKPNLKVGSSNPASSGLKKGERFSNAKAIEKCGDFCEDQAQILLASPQLVSAMPASPLPFVARNEDGTSTGPLYVRGGATNHWTEDADGFTVCERPGYGEGHSTWFYCVQGADGDLEIKPNLQVGSSDPAESGLKKGERLSNSKAIEKCGDLCKEPGNANRRLTGMSNERRKLQGSLKNLVVLFKFADHESRTVPSAKDIDTLMNRVGGDAALAPTGSVRDVFLANSYGKFTIDSVVAPWVTIQYTEEYCTNGNSGRTAITHACLKDALSKVDPFIDFADFNLNKDAGSDIDGITFLHSGFGAEWGGTDSYGTSHTNRMWSHTWQFSEWTSAEGVRVSKYHISPAVWGRSGSEIGRIGVIAHNIGHSLGLPDLYDSTNTASDPAGRGLGSYSLMANSWGFDGSQRYPPQMDPWSKIQVGWANVVQLDSYATGMTISPSFSTNQYYKISTGYKPSEYLLIEYRAKIKFDAAMPKPGLAIYHIDELADHEVQSYPGSTITTFPTAHYRVSLIQADGKYNLEKNVNSGDAEDLFRSGGVSTLGPGSSGGYPNTDSYQGSVVETGHSITNIGPAGGATMTFDFTGSGCNSDADCSDNDMCNGIETCENNQCISGTALSCSDDNLCTTDMCHPSSGCAFKEVVCDDGNPFTLNVCSEAKGCVFPANPTCNGDGICNGDETCESCPEDCVKPGKGSATCGNGICEGGNGEDSFNCGADCNGRTNGANRRKRFYCGAGHGCSKACNSNGFKCTMDPVDDADVEDTCCGNSVCEFGETAGNCASDCMLGQLRGTR